MLLLFLLNFAFKQLKHVIVGYSVTHKHGCMNHAVIPTTVTTKPYNRKRIGYQYT
jgi:hypothetical protein